MNLQPNKLFLQAYGLGRMVLGVGELVGLSAGYFLQELLLNSPKNLSLFVIDQELLALAYLAVLMRSIFHITAGIGIARLREWGRFWIICGWPIMVMITAGLVFSFYNDWLLGGMVGNFSQSFSFIGAFAYLAWICFDYIFVCANIKRLSHRDEKSAESAIDVKAVSTVFFVAVVSFSILFFLGSPIKQGFHKGFYKSRGKKASATQKVQAIEPARAAGTEAKPEVSSTVRKSKEPVKIDSIYTRAEAPGPQASGTMDASAKRVEETRKAGVRRGMPYRATIGFAAGLCIIMAFLLQIFDSGLAKFKMVSESNYVLLSLGFFLWTVYGLGMKLLPVILSSAVCCLLCLYIFLNKQKED